MNKKEIRTCLQSILWDYQIDPYEFYETALGTRERVGWFTQERALLRMLERLGWYDLIRLFGIEHLTQLLSKELVSRIRIPQLREKYELARKVLQGETLSFSGRSPEYRKKIRHTLLSRRWYRAQQGVLQS
jgi:hypothetical protein